MKGSLSLDDTPLSLLTCGALVPLDEVDLLYDGTVFLCMDPKDSPTFAFLLPCSNHDEIIFLQFSALVLHE